MSKADSPEFPDDTYDRGDKELLERVAERDDDIGELAQQIIDEVEFDV